MSIKTIEGFLTQLLEGLPSPAKAESKGDQRALMELHHGVNPLYWFCLFRSSKLLEKAQEKFDYQQWVYAKSTKFDPFEYSIGTKDRDLIEVWADYFERNPDKLSIPNKEILEFLFASPSSKLHDLAISKFQAESYLREKRHSIRSYSLDPMTQYQCVKSKSPLVDSGVVNQFRKREKLYQAQSDVLQKSTTIPIACGAGRLTWLIHCAQKMSPNQKVRLRPLIQSIFAKTKIFMLIYMLLILTGTVLFYVTVIFQYYEWFTLLPLFLIYGLASLFEVVVMVNRGLSYFLYLNNWVDLLFYPSAIALSIYVVSEGYEDLEDEASNAVVVYVLYEALSRAIYALRVFDSTRHLILIIWKVSVNITPLIVVLAVYVVGSGAISILVNITNNQNVFTWRQFRISTDVTYNYGFGNWGDTDNFNAVNFAYYIWSGISIGAVLFNMIVGIITGSILAV